MASGAGIRKHATEDCGSFLLLLFSLFHSHVTKKRIPLPGGGERATSVYIIHFVFASTLHVSSQCAREDNKIHSHLRYGSGLFFSPLHLAVVTNPERVADACRGREADVWSMFQHQRTTGHLDSTTNYCSDYSLKLVYLFLYRSTSSYKLYVFC